MLGRQVRQASRNRNSDETELLEFYHFLFSKAFRFPRGVRCLWLSLPRAGPRPPAGELGVRVWCLSPTPLSLRRVRWAVLCACRGWACVQEQVCCVAAVSSCVSCVYVSVCGVRLVCGVDLVFWTKYTHICI